MLRRCDTLICVTYAKERTAQPGYRMWSKRKINEKRN